jgi:hypothetical protein
VIHIHIGALDAAYQIGARVGAEVGVGEEPYLGCELITEARAEAQARIGGIGDVERRHVDPAARFDVESRRGLDNLSCRRRGESQQGNAGEEYRGLLLHDVHWIYPLLFRLLVPITR